MSAGSVSKIEINVEIKGKSQLKCELKRHLAPKTVGTITRSLPLEGNAHIMGNSFVYMETKINVGGERQRSQFKKGDVSFMPLTGSICFFLNDTDSTKAMTPIGKITSNEFVLSNIKSGDVLVITQAAV
ncbi:MAG TPA: cyclophilin-like fold protein [Nitrosopumilaceae archaeon]|nr:cyclophilin-like fold protein [Nitrosopumilaceae archaeon]